MRFAFGLLVVALAFFAPMYVSSQAPSSVQERVAAPSLGSLNAGATQSNIDVLLPPPDPCNWNNNLPQCDGGDGAF